MLVVVSTLSRLRLRRAVQPSASIAASAVMLLHRRNNSGMPSEGEKVLFRVGNRKRQSFTACHRRKRAGQNISAWHEAGALESLAARDVLGVAAGGGNVTTFAADSLQLLHQIGTKSAPPMAFRHLHVNVSVRRIVMKKDSTGCGDVALDLQNPLRVRV